MIAFDYLDIVVPVMHKIVPLIRAGVTEQKIITRLVKLLPGQTEEFYQELLADCKLVA